jgi:hypothetical protein
VSEHRSAAEERSSRGARSSPGAELSSLTTALDELTSRVAAIAESLAGTEDDLLASDLFEVERSLREAIRRLAHARATRRD